MPTFKVRDSFKCTKEQNFLLKLFLKNYLYKGVLVKKGLKITALERLSNDLFLKAKDTGSKFSVVSSAQAQQLGRRA